MGEAWILDIDTTLKPVYGRQEGAEVGYNPQKLGWPSQVIHVYEMSGMRLERSAGLHLQPPKPERGRDDDLVLR